MNDEDVAPVRRGPAPEAIERSMAATRPWVRFIAGFGLALSGLAGLGGVFVMLTGIQDQVPRVAGLLYLGFGVLWASPALSLWRYAAHLARVGEGGHEGGMVALARALEEQRRFWRMIGGAAVFVAGAWGLAVLGAIVAYLLPRFL